MHYSEVDTNYLKDSECRAIHYGWGNGLRSHWSLHSLEDHSSSLSSHPTIHFLHSTQTDLLKMQIQPLPFSTQNPLVKSFINKNQTLHSTAWVIPPPTFFMSYFTLFSWCLPVSHIVPISVANHLVCTLSCIYWKSVWAPGMCQELSHVLRMHQWTKRKSFCPLKTYAPVREDRWQTIKKMKV